MMPFTTMKSKLRLIRPTLLLNLEKNYKMGFQRSSRMRLPYRRSLKNKSNLSNLIQFQYIKNGNCEQEALLLAEGILGGSKIKFLCEQIIRN
mmetsp:Transcript_38861/g.71542  ORF Transcript_38861/g.71542 Transcript_38861/m.71542 type:complete len:92 (-) Transcript_38861:111-386(-)